MASWFVRSTPDRVVWVRALAGIIVLCSEARHSHGASLHPGVQMSTSKCARGNPVMD